MNSPVIFPFSSFIKIDRNSDTPVFLQITHQMINAIQRGFLTKGMKLPGTRILSQLLGINRNIVVAVFEELESQGWIEILPNKGCFILNQSNEKPEKLNSYNQNYLALYPESTHFTFKQSSLLDNPFESSTCSLIFNDGLPDIRLSQTNLSVKFYSSILKRKKNSENINNFHPEKRVFFREQLSNFLNLTRGLHISKDNILVTRSIEMSIFIAAQILISPQDIVIVGELSYFTTNMIFQQSGAEILTVPVDEEGIDVEAVKKICEKKKIRMLYIAPHHHYPTTVPLSAQRRIELLELSGKYGFIILEDDYDYDFHYNNNRVLPLASADQLGTVIYMGSFGRSLAPGFRTGFIVAPQNLISEMYKFLGIIDRQGDIVMEYALGEMIKEGEIHRHLKKVSKIYQQRRDHFADLLNNNLGDYIEFKIPAGGLAFWFQWKSPVNLMKLRKNCMGNDLFIPKALLYQTKKLTALRLGFGNFTLGESADAVKKLKESLENYNLNK